jgi:hypothetical protein
MKSSISLSCIEIEGRVFESILSGLHVEAETCCWRLLIKVIAKENV